ncbi:hypothetical protein [Shinella sp. HZN7]|uniref:hypothetical protein n=1 Tax=Shinella sp. (strain HZN7) TaxID=879274 RepID=UPI0007DA519D|nr:hypothetical protein [Shinella sp. HZN7]ANH05041.1 hypothetical protein shn_13995 [Shinella sp. HZN7]
MPSFDYSWMPEVPPPFTPGDASGGLEIVDVTLWIAKRLQEDKPLSPELENLFWAQARLGWTDQVSLAGIDERWRHLAHLPEPEGPLSAELQAHFDKLERERQSVVAAL